MRNLIAFLEGVTTFISPCLLPMLPIYLSYFAGGRGGEGSRQRALRNALGFVLGFTLVFVSLGAFAGSLGSLLRRYGTVLNLVTGLVVVVFGLHFMGVLRLGFLDKTYRRSMDTQNLGFFSSLLFGVIFSIGWTPCAGVFLGSALLLASQQGSTLQGMLMLLSYSAGLGLPFLLSALLLDRLKSSFTWIKAHYQTINRVAGGFLVLMGILMMTGLLGRALAFLSF